jgi:DNA segregation ATPase FtsK/SpoIIIE, S-DNA-T family
MTTSKGVIVMADLVLPDRPLSIWQPVHLGTDEIGAPVRVTLAERNMLIGGEPGSGKSVALQLVVAHGALSPDCRLVLVDGKRVELGLWRACADRFIGPSIDDAIDTMHWLQAKIDERTDLLLQMKRRKVTPDLGWPVYLVPVDEVAYFSATVGTSIQQKAYNAANRDVVARGRAPGIIAVEATQRPSADIIPTSLRDLFGYRWAFRCSTEASSDTILGHGWSSKGYTAEDIDPQARGVSWLRAEDGIPRRIKAAYLTDDHIITLAEHAAAMRASGIPGEAGIGKVIPLREGDAA